MIETPATKKSLVLTICPYCGAGCGLYVVAENGKAVGIEYMPELPLNEGALCPKGNAALEVLYHADRLRYPMEKTKGKWERISWDEAIDLVASNLAQVRSDYGPDALGFLSSAKCTNEENYLFQKLARLIGTNNVDHCARLCHSPTVAILSKTLGSGAMTNLIPELANSTCIFVIGSNFAETHPLVSRWVLDAKERGADVIVADARFTPTVWLADLFLQIKPGTDVALINGMIRVILDEGLFKRDFIARRTTGFDELARSLEGYTLEEAAAITGVPVASIIKAARAYARAEAGAMVYCMGITQHITGSDNVAACVNLALVCGQIGRPGAGLFPLRGQNNVQGACDMGALAEFYPGYQRVDNEAARGKFEEAWGVSLSPKPGLTVMEMVNAAAEGRIKAMYIMGENPLLSDPNAHHTREALSKLDFLVVQDIFLTETAQLANVVLPAVAWAEKEGTVTSTERRVQWTEQAAIPPEEAKTDLWIICQVAKRLGFDLGDADATMVLTEINRVVSIYAGITPERVRNAVGGLIWPCPSPEHPGTPILYTQEFGTPDGRGKFTPVTYRPPVEQTRADFPFVLITGRVVMHYNTGSMTRRSLSLAKRVPEAFIEVNPRDAERLSLAQDEKVRVATERGEASARVEATERVAEGVVFMPFHFPEVNVLTIDALDPKAKIPEYKVAACRIERGDD
jgi:formate dehydrogenase major subunit